MRLITILVLTSLSVPALVTAQEVVELPVEACVMQGSPDPAVFKPGEESLIASARAWVTVTGLADRKERLPVRLMTVDPPEGFVITANPTGANGGTAQEARVSNKPNLVGWCEGGVDSCQLRWLLTMEPERGRELPEGDHLKISLQWEGCKE